MLRNLIVLILLSLNFGCSDQNLPAPDATRIIGRITDAQTGNPLKNVIVNFNIENARDITNENGEYSLDVVLLKPNMLHVHLFNYVRDDLPQRKRIIKPKPGGIIEYDIVMNPRIWRTESISSDSLRLIAYEQGRKTAEKELKQGSPKIWGGGMEWSGPTLNKTTGLPHLPAIGDVRYGHEEDVVKGHNDRIYEYIAKNGYPVIKRWWMLDDYMFIQAFIRSSYRKDISFQMISPATSPIIRPDSVCSVSCKKILYKHYLEIKYLGETSLVDFFGTNWMNTSLIWGPEGTDVAIVKDKSKTFWVLDLVEGTLHRYENQIYIHSEIINYDRVKETRDILDSISTSFSN